MVQSDDSSDSFLRGEAIDATFHVCALASSSVESSRSNETYFGKTCVKGSRCSLGRRVSRRIVDVMVLQGVARVVDRITDQ